MADDGLKHRELIAENALKVPMEWAGRTQRVSNDREVWTCGGCVWPHWCAGRAQCHRAQVMQRRFAVNPDLTLPDDR